MKDLHNILKYSLPAAIPLKDKKSYEKVDPLQCVWQSNANHPLQQVSWQSKSKVLEFEIPSFHWWNSCRSIIIRIINNVSTAWLISKFEPTRNITMPRAVIITFIEGGTFSPSHFHRKVYICTTVSTQCPRPAHTFHNTTQKITTNVGAMGVGFYRRTSLLSSPLPLFSQTRNI